MYVLYVVLLIRMMFIVYNIVFDMKSKRKNVLLIETILMNFIIIVIIIYTNSVDSKLNKLINALRS